jgi:hypothetical protein
LVDSSVPVKLPDGAAGVELFVGDGVVGGVVGFLLGAVLAGAVVVGCVIVGAVGDGDSFGAVFFAVFDGDALAEAGADAVGDGGADTDSPVGVLVAATGVTPGTWVLNENSAARPATVLPRVRTARRIQPPGGKWLLGSGRCRNGG